MHDNMDLGLIHGFVILLFQQHETATSINFLSNKVNNYERLFQGSLKITAEWNTLMILYSNI